MIEQQDGTKVADSSSLDVFAGPPGGAIFLAAFASCAKNSAIANLAASILEQSFRSAVDQPATLGGLTGQGSLAYALAIAGELLERPGLLDRAVDLLTEIDAATLFADHHLDIVRGAAGTLCVAASVAYRLDAEDSRQARLLRLAEQCGDHLLDRQTRLDGGAVSWPAAEGGPALGGFAHGTSGIAVALGRLLSLNLSSPSPELMAAICGALNFEDQLYVSEHGNWLPAQGEQRRPVGWCYGAAGIGMARLDLLRAPLPSAIVDRLHRDLHRAAITCWTAPTTPFDHVCCGTMSRTEALLAMAEQRLDSSLNFAAESTAYFALRVAKSRGQFRVGSSHEGDPSFFHGLSGIGYTFLRLAEPGGLPSILLLR